jgi:hypothetical protein
MTKIQRTARFRYQAVFGMNETSKILLRPVYNTRGLSAWPEK